MGAQASSPEEGSEEQAVRLFQKVHLPGRAGVSPAFFKKMRANRPRSQVFCNSRVFTGVCAIFGRYLLSKSPPPSHGNLGSGENPATDTGNVLERKTLKTTCFYRRLREFQAIRRYQNVYVLTAAKTLIFYR